MVLITTNNNGNEKQKLEKIGLSIVWKNLFILRLALTAGIGGLLFGYDTGVISGALLYIRDEFPSVERNTSLQETIVSMAVAGAVVGAGFGGLYSERFGRRISLLSADVVFFVGAILMGAAPNPAVLIVGRLLVGLGVGVASISSPLYISEISPPKVRGALCSLNAFLLTGAQFLSYVINYGFTKVRGTWRWMLGIAAVPPAVQFALMIFMPESPRWLIRKEREEEARKVLDKIYPDGEEAAAEALALRQSVEEEKAHHRKFRYGDIWEKKEIRLALITGVGLQVFQQFVGINSVLYYSPTIVQLAGFASNSTSLLLSLTTSGLNVVGTVISFFLLDKTGRRKLIISSLVGIIACLALLGILFRYTADNSPLVSRTVTMQYPGNNTCPAYSSATTTWDCTKCLDVAPGCGFCSNKAKRLSPGACLISNPTSKDLCHVQSGEWFLQGCPSKYGWLAIVGLGLYIISYAPGMGTIPWIFNSEVYPPNFVSVCGGIAGTANWMANLIVAQTFLTMTKSIGTSMTFFTFGIFAVVGLVFMVIMMPETKGIPMEQMEEILKRRAHENTCFGFNLAKPRESPSKEKEGEP